MFIKIWKLINILRRPNIILATISVLINSCVQLTFHRIFKIFNSTFILMAKL